MLRTDNFLKRFKLKSLADLPDYDELMRKIAELNAASESSSSYLYEKDVYDPEKGTRSCGRKTEESGSAVPTASSFPIF